MLSLITFFPDSSAYTGFAEIMRQSADWFHAADITDYQDVIHHRLPFYPFLIAIGQTLFGKSGALIFIVTLQIALFSFSAQRFYLFMRKVDFARWRSSIATLAYLTGIPLFFVTGILTDSFFTSLGLLAFTSTTLFMLDKATLVDKVILAVAFVLMSLLRESTLYFALTFIPFLITMFFKKNRKNMLMLAAFIYLPCLGVNATLNTWNIYRTGQAFVTTGLTTALLNPLLDFKNTYPKLNYPTPFDAYLEAQLPYDFTDGLQAAEHLALEQKLNMPQLEKVIKTAFFNAWKDHFWRRAAIAITNIQFMQLGDIFNPMQTLKLFLEHDQDYEVPRLSAIFSYDFSEEGGIQKLSFILLMSFFRLLSLWLVGCGLYKLYLRLKAPHRDILDWAYFSLALQALLWWGINAAVHMEPRYIMTSYAVLALLAMAPRKVLAGENAE